MSTMDDEKTDPSVHGKAASSVPAYPPPPTDEWQTGLFECWEDCHLTSVGLFCPQCLHADTATRVDSFAMCCPYQCSYMLLHVLCLCARALGSGPLLLLILSAAKAVVGAAGWSRSWLLLALDVPSRSLTAGGATPGVSILTSHVLWVDKFIVCGALGEFYGGRIAPCVPSAIAPDPRLRSRKRAC